MSTNYVKYRHDDWKKSHDVVGNLIEQNEGGKGAIGHLKSANEALEDAEEDCRQFDVDNVVNFTFNKHREELEALYEDYEVLYDFSFDAGGYIEQIIDKEFYDDYEKFVDKLADTNIKDYRAYHDANGDGITTKVTIEDVFKKGDYYSDVISDAYEKWKLENPELKNRNDNKRDFYRYLEDEVFGFEYKTSTEKIVSTVATVTNMVAGAIIPVYCPNAVYAFHAIDTAYALYDMAENGRIVFRSGYLGYSIFANYKYNEGMVHDVLDKLGIKPKIEEILAGFDIHPVK